MSTMERDRSDETPIDIDCRCPLPNPKWLAIWGVHQCSHCGRRVRMERVVFGGP